MKYKLTERQRDVLTLVAQGKTNRQIGEALGLTTGTVKCHIMHIIELLDAADRTQAAVYGVLLQLITVQPPIPRGY